MATTPLTTAAQMDIRLSAIGVTLRADHAPSDAVTFAISRGSNDVRFYLQRYPLAQLASSDWVKDVATEFAAYHLCILRNNPVPKVLLDSLAEYKRMLEAIMSGRVGVPDLSPGKNFPVIVRQRAAPEMYPAVRTLRQGTTGRAEGYVSRRDPTEPNSW